MNFSVIIDDFGWTTKATPGPDGVKYPDTKLEIGKRIHDAMSGLPYVAAVIPGALDRDGIRWIESKPAGLTIALHGWDHIPVKGMRNEYYEQSVETIREKLNAGLDVIGRTPYTVPPWNATTDQFLVACGQVGLRYIFTTHEQADSPAPFKRGDVWVVPRWRDTYGMARHGKDDLIRRVEDLAAIPGSAILTLHANWEFAVDQSLKNVKALAAALKGRCVTIQEYTEGLR